TAHRVRLVGRRAELRLHGGHRRTALRSLDAGGLDGDLPVDGQGFAESGRGEDESDGDQRQSKVASKHLRSPTAVGDSTVGGNIRPAMAKSAAVAMGRLF